MAGLNNSGKTSILLLLNRKFSLLSSIKPTFKAKRSLQSLSLLGVTISHWDLGGQESFRKIYLEQKEKYFADAQSIFFVIDIQQAVRYGEAIKYLSEILRVTKEMEQELPNLLILFHKYDPDIKNDPEINKEISELQDKIRTIDNGFKFTFYKTSIYDEPSTSRRKSLTSYW